MIASFDPSMTHFGWVIMDEHQTGKDSVIDFGTFKTDPEDGLRVQRLLMQKERVRKLLSDRGIKFVVMEAPIWQDFNTEVLFALNQFVHEVFLDQRTFVLYVQPMSLKKAAVPGMNPQEIQKHHVVHQAKEELERHGKRFSEHVADAYFAAKIGAQFYRWHILKELKDSDLTPDEQHMFCGQHTYTRGVKKGLTEYTGIIYRENDQFFDYSKPTLKRLPDIIKEIQDDKEGT